MPAKKDFTQVAFSVFQQAIGEEPIPDRTPSPNAKRGDARAKALTAEQRKEIAIKAAQKRWSKT
jgi:hypothetical protein